MIEKLRLLFDWSEVWALLIPLSAWMIKRGQPRYMTPVVLYLCLALVFNLIGDFIGDFKKYLPGWLHSNNVLYNIHSLIRFVCFGYFFRLLGKRFRGPFDLIISIGALVFLIYNFTFIERFTNPDHLSGNLLATEAYVLLVYCMQYYLSKLREEPETFPRTKDFWVVTGLSIYVVVNFFVFLFYVPLLNENFNIADRMWDVHNVAYILLCIFIAKAFHAPA